MSGLILYSIKIKPRLKSLNFGFADIYNFSRLLPVFFVPPTTGLKGDIFGGLLYQLKECP